jgi:hypothetical protein
MFGHYKTIIGWKLHTELHKTTETLKEYSLLLLTTTWGCRRTHGPLSYYNINLDVRNMELNFFSTNKGKITVQVATSYLFLSISLN